MLPRLERAKRNCVAENRKSEEKLCCKLADIRKSKEYLSVSVL